MPPKYASCASFFDLWNIHELRQDGLHAQVTEHAIKEGAHPSAGSPEKAHSLPAICRHRQLHEHGMELVVCSGSDDVVQASMLEDEALGGRFK